MEQGKSGADVQDAAATPTTSPPPARARRPVSPLTVLGVILLAAGLVCLGWVGWQYFGTNIVSKNEAVKEITQLEETWGNADPAPATTEPAPTDPAPTDPAPTDAAPLPASAAGTAQWLIRIPSFGSDYEWPIIAGIEVDDLKKGVGWYPTTAQPGQIGNFALAGHRITNGEPFRRMLELKVGDTVVVETRDSILTYELTSSPGQLTVQDTESWVLDPVPGHEGAVPTEALITLTTCEDLFHSPDRSVAFGELVSTETK